MYLLKIGELAKLGDVSEVTLRYYDKKGLLSPISIDKFTGYRYYSVRQVMHLSLIQYLRSLGFGVEKIKEMFNTDDKDLISRMIMERKLDIDRELSSLSNQRRIISHILDEYSLMQGHPPCGTPFLRSFPERYFYVYEVDQGFEEAWYSQNYELSIINMMSEMSKCGISGNGYVNIGSIIKRSDALNGTANYYAVYSAVGRQFADFPGVVRIPEHVYICNICDKPENELEYMKMLYDESNRRSMFADDYFREEVVLYPHMDSGRRGGLYLQAVPVALK